MNSREYKSLIKENREMVHWRNGSFYELKFVQGIHSINLNHLTRLVSEKTEKKLKMSHVKSHRIQSARASNNQIWNNLRKKTNDYCNNLQTESNINIHRSKPI